jgi:hypothetical protein
MGSPFFGTVTFRRRVTQVLLRLLTRMARASTLVRLPFVRSILSPCPSRDPRRRRPSLAALRPVLASPRPEMTRGYNAREVRFSATLGEEPEVELALAWRC